MFVVEHENPNVTLQSNSALILFIKKTISEIYMNYDYYRIKFCEFHGLQYYDDSMDRWLALTLRNILSFINKKYAIYRKGKKKKKERGSVLNYVHISPKSFLG